MKLKKSHIVAIVVVVVLGGYYWYQKSHSSTTPTQYVTSTAEKGTLITSVSGSGNVIVDQIANVDPTIGGTVANLAVAVGDTVKPGQLLFTIVNDQLGVNVAKAVASLDQAQNAVDSAEVTKRSAKADLDSAKKKNRETSGTYTRRQIQVLEDKIDIADEGITNAEKDLAATKADYNNQISIAAKRKVTAPIGGTVSAVNVKNGDDLSKVSSSSTRQAPIIIGDLQTLKARVVVNEVDISHVSLGQKVTLTFNAVDGLTMTGKVEKMDALGTVAQSVVTYNVVIGFDSLDPRIKPEMSVSAAIITNVKQDVLLVPVGAVKTQGNASYVEVFNSGTTPEQVVVEIGATNDTETEIVSGIKVGDKVVTQTIVPGASTGTTSSSGQGSGGFRFPGLGGGRG